MTEAIAFNLDYNFVDLGTVSFSGNDAGGPTTVHTEIDGSFQAHVVTAGLNLRF